jgi:hypothetical protein
MMNAAPALRSSDEITRDIDAWAQVAQDPHLDAGYRAFIKRRVATLGAELVAAVDQEEVTAAELAAYGRPEQYATPTHLEGA